jgi:hypothetical protein
MVLPPHIWENLAKNGHNEKCINDLVNIHAQDHLYEYSYRPRSVTTIRGAQCGHGETIFQEVLGVEEVGKSLSAALEITLDKLDLDDDDRAAGRLAMRYAVALDEAAAVERQADRVLRRALAEAEDVELIDDVKALRNKLVARAALVALGQRLESLLADLGATPGGRSKQGRGKPGGELARRDNNLMSLRAASGGRGA